jgi:site-specific recombinase XerD
MFMSERVTLTDDRERAVVGLWRLGHLSSGTIQIYLQWVRRFRAYCGKRKLVEADQLSLAGVLQFTRVYAGPRLKGRRIARGTCDGARNALHAWACALRALGTPLQAWRSTDASAVLPPLLDEYCRYRRAHNGVAESTLHRDIETAQGFIAQLRHRRKPVGLATLPDVDAFVQTVARRVSKGTVADTCSSLRAFLRFLHVTGRLAADLARSVIAPRFRLSERPPRTLPWGDVKLILRSIRRSEPPGKRDFAILLLLATYGLGAAEVLGLRLQDLDWQAGILRARRPKTKVLIELPLLPAVAQALTSYLRWERPPAKSIPYLFLRKNMPYEPITSSVIRYRIRHYARLAGIADRVIGAHAFRHSHATRQVDAGANLKVVSEILGHRSSSSTSVYVRVALRRLRGVALPVPR